MCLYEVLQDYPVINYHIVNFSVRRGEYSASLVIITVSAILFINLL